MPSWLLGEVTTALELSLRCRVSFEIAEIRFIQLTRGTKRKPAVEGVQELIDSLKSAAPVAPVDRRLQSERDRVNAWERARHIAGENPTHTRRSDDSGTGYRIERRQYGNALSPYGWFVKDGQALSYYGKDC